MQKNRSYRPLVSAVAGALVATAMLAGTVAAQGAPPRPRQNRVAGDSTVQRRTGPAGTPGMARPDRGQDRGPGRGTAGGPASSMLRMRQQLDLSDDQVKRLEALQQANAPRANEADMLRARADLMEATRGDGNLSGARAALDKMSRLRNDQMLAGIKARQDARNVLTAAQKSKLDQARGGMRDRMAGGGRRGEMKGMRQGMRGRGGDQGMGRQGMGRQGMGRGIGRPGMGPQGPGQPGFGPRGVGPAGRGFAPGGRQGFAPAGRAGFRQGQPGQPGMNGGPGFIRQNRMQNPMPQPPMVRRDDQ